jgi:hypothetical protein
MAATACSRDVGIVSQPDSSASRSPVGTYTLRQCTLAPPSNDGFRCETGGSAHHIWLGGRLELHADGSAIRVFSTEFIATGSGYPPDFATDSSNGTWAALNDTVFITWNTTLPTIPLTPTTTTTPAVRIGSDTLLDSSIWNEYIFFWFVRQ